LFEIVSLIGIAHIYCSQWSCLISKNTYLHFHFFRIYYILLYCKQCITGSVKHHPTANIPFTKP